ncbi:hypothetical protein Taro_020039 [Colocasia esculenta]|uniref:Putative plant transposon protein domain-containing protein n=1 Tax=Colocasia esculenta TaxID=4460 RepID=A0A843V425_COLES|nr:hypothetical protein [Colocasia esculenta]
MAASVISGSLGGYGAEFLTLEQQERFTFVKTKVCGNKAVDVADLEKNGMHSVVSAMSRMQWMEITTFSEVSYPDLVKAFYVCLRIEEDGSLVSSVKGTQIKIDHELLHLLFGVKTSGHSGVHTVDAQAKGLGIIGPGFRLRDGKIDINQFNAFNRLLHFMVCQILVPRSATFSTCTKADSDMMFWAIQNKEINMAEVMIERMRFARDQIWDTKSKLNVSLPYAHLLTKIFKHFGVDLSGAVVEKMGQAIRSRNLRKSGFSIVDGIWSKTSVAEGEAIIGDIPDFQEEVLEASAEPAAVALAAEVEASVVVSAVQEAAGPSELAARVAGTGELAGSSEVTIESQPPEARSSVTPEVGGNSEEEVVASGHVEELVAPEDIIMEDAPIQGEQESMEEDAPTEGKQLKGGPTEAAQCDEPMGSVPADEVFASSLDDGTQGEEHDNPPGNDARDGETASSSESDDDQQPPASEAREKGKEVVSDVPLLADTPFERQVKQKIVINLKPVIERMDVQGTILCSLQSDVNSIFMSQASSSKEISSIKNAMKWFNNEMGSMKTMLSEILKVVGAQVTPHPPPATQVPESGPSGSSVPVSGPAAAAATAEAEVNEQGSSGPAEQDKGSPRPAEKVSGPSGPLEFEPVQNLAEEAVLVPEPPTPTSSQTPVPPSPPSSSTAPPAPQTFKKPQPRPISSPTPFPSQSTSSPASSPVSSTIVSPLPSSPPELPPASSFARPSSSGPSTSDTFTLPTLTLDSIFNPPTPPSFITIIPEGAQLTHVEIQDIKDEFEVAILRSVLAVGTHTHRTGSSSPVSKKRRLTSAHPVSSEPCYPPL